MTSQQNIKDIEKTSPISLPAIRTNPFGSNISGEKAYRRAERVIAAIYVLTQYMSDMEPLKVHARESAHHLLKDVLDLWSGFRVGGGSERIARTHARVREMISVAQLLSVGGYSSKENADLLTRALEELSQFIDSSSTTTLSERTVFTKEDLLLDQAAPRSAPRERIGSETKDTHSGHSRESAPQSPKGHKLISDVLTGRKAAILEVLKDGKKMAIGDIASFVVGCSEKTIQRELASLVSDGTIRREGEKRWSRYFLA